MDKPPADLLQQIDAASVEPGSIALWHTGGAGYVMRTPATTIYVDPFCGESLDPGTWVRNLPSAFDPSQVKRCDLVMSTHEHFDHCDPNALGPLREVTAASFAGPATSIAKARGWGWPDDRLRALAWGDAFEVGDVRITVIRSVDPMAEGCNGYVFEAQGLVVVNMGDSLWFDGIGKELEPWRVDALCVSVAQNPVGGTYYMSEVDAVRMARDVGVRVLVPHHWDLWEWVMLDPRRIQAVAPWYAPDVQVRPARFAERMTLHRAGEGVAVY
jgi:L-ascorbate 6-phosphate lactonase